MIEELPYLISSELPYDVIEAILSSVYYDRLLFLMKFQLIFAFPLLGMFPFLA